MDTVSFFTGLCGVYSIAGAYAGVGCGILMWEKDFLNKKDRIICAGINISWIASVCFMVWRLFA